MKFKQLLTKTLLVAAGLCVGGSAWGAGYTRTLTDALEVAGYKAKAFYNFQNNTPAVLPTSGDLRYRDGDIWGLHNFAAAGRSATATIPVANSDILVIQEYSSSYVTTINRGTENTTLTASTGYRVFNITTTADDITFTVPRYGGIVAAFVMEKDNTVKTGNYTINYKASGETVKTVSGTDLAVGTEIAILSSFFEGGKKYITDDGQATKLTIAEGDNNLDITVTEAAKYSCMINMLAGDKPLSSIGTSVYKGESEILYYQKAYEYEGKWYFIDGKGTSPAYGVAFDNVSGDQSENITTFAAWDNVAYFAEAENMTIGAGSWAANGSYLTWRSNGMAKRLAANSYIYTDEIAAGVYNVFLWARNNRSAGNGTETIALFLRDEDGNLTNLETSFPGWARGGFEDTKKATITIPSDGKKYSLVINNNTEYTSNLELDYVYLEKLPSTVSVPCTTGFATYANHDYALDFTGVTSLTAYTATVSGTTVTFTKATKVPAGTGLLLKGETKNVPVIASAAVVDNLLYAPTTAVAGLNYDQDDCYNYILTQPAGKSVGFYQANNNSVAVGKAYLRISKSTGVREFSFIGLDGESETTGIQSMENGHCTMDIVYDLQGRRVAQPTKGLYIVNSKKVIMK